MNTVNQWLVTLLEVPRKNSWYLGSKGLKKTILNVLSSSLLINFFSTDIIRKKTFKPDSPSEFFEKSGFDSIVVLRFDDELVDKSSLERCIVSIQEL